MRISSKTYYGLRAMAYLAECEEVAPISDISYDENIPLAFLEKILQKLKNAGLLDSHKGSLGGYSLAKKPENIAVSDIFKALGETFDSTPCMADNCPRHTGCRTIQFWQKLENSIYETLSSITLAELIR